MASPIDNIGSRAHALQEQILAWQKLILSDAGAIAIADQKLSASEILQPLFERLKRLYIEDLPIAKLRTNSDLIIHAEGPGAHGDAPQLRAVNWLGKTMRAQFIKLTAAALPVSDTVAITLAKKAEWGVTGLVPGSIFIGFALKRPHSFNGFEMSDEIVYQQIINAVQSLSIVPEFIGDKEVNLELADAITDPALRDAAIMAALQLCPTGKSVFDSVEIYAPAGHSGVLHKNEREVLKRALKAPLMRKNQFGSFVGTLNEIDLDSSRFELRNVEQVGTLRCAMAFTHDDARNWLGQKVKVSGAYETDLYGRPRLMKVDAVSIMREQMALESRPSQDRSSININEPWEVAYWAKHFGVSEGELIDTVRRISPSVYTVKKRLGLA